MVTRKPVPQSSIPSNNTSPPYPISPGSSDPHHIPRPGRNHNAIYDHSADNIEPNVWDEEEHSHPDPKSLPHALRVGPSTIPPKPSQDTLKPNSSVTNPFLRRQHSQSSQSAVSDGKESSADIWNELTEKPTQPDYPPPPPPPPISQVTQQFSSMGVSRQDTNPWQPIPNEKLPLQTSSLQPEDSGNEAWSGANPPNTVNSSGLSQDSQQPVLVDIDEPESPAWDEDDYDEGEGEEGTPVSPKKSTLPTHETQEILEDQHAWDSTHGQSSNQSQTIPVQPSENTQYSDSPAEGWNLIDHDTIPENVQQSGVVGADGTEISRIPSEEIAPALPPRNAQENPPQPPRPILDATNTSATPITTPGTSAAVLGQKKETYEIKKISWHDINAQHNPRISPILVQNANGPCPLLALVNALTLSTPANLETALVETLRSREQVSLGLLLDAVFDELMSGRRGDAAQELPDVGDLYSFLLTLHTGMNVNPLFFPVDSTQSAIDPRNSMLHIHPAQRDSSLPGTFEETREMKLYGTFSIPLIHGWLPEEESPAYMALKRSAKSYEDAQNLMFHEEELEEKLVAEGLSFEEQGILEDISTIKAFFISAATQLTAHGLDLITESMSPGAVAILFRNDHFSTIFKHPTTLQLLQLVTDSGYAGHAEVVWEGLIDVNGERAEFYSGDFRLVGGPSTLPQGNEEGNWTTVTGRRNNNRVETSHDASLENQQESQNHEQGTNTEQEDHDFALALQLQEEEDERNRNETARRQRESVLSQQFIEQQGSSNNSSNAPVSQRGGNGRGNSTRGRGVNVPVRGGSIRGSTSIRGRPAIPPRNSNVATPAVDPEAGIDAPPPTYEQAATEPAYQPPDNHPAHPNADPSRRTSAYTESVNSQQLPPANAAARRNTASYGGIRRGSQTLIDQVPGRRIQAPTQGLPTTQQPERQKDCVVM
ncbi:uncharacterized protein EAF01_008226 [Botrytis porri]|uniref:MINDY deubiquitinase domain-containing protein n=1 Tax=Botrytis porri TaxID=87229 RepID=A0A4Z1L6S5_9HELO|nr:uncharacterized protein EAF01_008226 [Botrytis porri]KAF7899013.1 hypothetical protein EAF01_008226 [Botrytis porri]TGO92532.1 hypothetical protein BPOR_0001g00170 [Botrytis porri]